MNYRSKCTLFLGIWNPELQLSMQTGLNSIIPSWDLSLLKTQRCSALFVDDSWSFCVHLSGSVTLHEFFWWTSAFFCIKTHHLMWSHRDKYLLEVFSISFGFRSILSVILTVPIHVIHSKVISPTLDASLDFLSIWASQCVNLFSQDPCEEVGKSCYNPILKTRVRSREVENMTALCGDTLSISALERVLHWG